MKHVVRPLGFAIACLLGGSGPAAQNRVVAEIPITVEGGKTIVPVTVGGASLRLILDTVATNYFATENASGKYLEFDQAAFYAHRVDVGALAATTPGWKADPRFMIEGASATLAPGFQLPRQARVGIKFLF